MNSITSPMWRQREKKKEYVETCHPVCSDTANSTHQFTRHQLSLCQRVGVCVGGSTRRHRTAMSTLLARRSHAKLGSRFPPLASPPISVYPDLLARLGRSLYGILVLWWPRTASPSSMCVGVRDCVSST